MTEKLDLSCWTFLARVDAQNDTKIEIADNEGQKGPHVNAVLQTKLCCHLTLLSVKSHKFKLEQ